MDYGQAVGQVGQLGTGIWGLVDAANIFGSKPKIAPWRRMNYGSEQQKGIQGNVSAFPEIKQLGDLYQSYATEQMNQLLPGFSDTLKQGQSTTQQMLADAAPLLQGEIPQDVKDQIQRSDAYQALSGGYAGSGMAHSLTARDLGLTSLDLMGRGASLAGQGSNAAQRWASLAKGETLDPASMFVTPQQTAAFDMQNELLRQQSLQNKYNVAAMPNPQSVGAYNSLMGMFGSMAGSGIGSGLGSSGDGMSSSGMQGMDLGMLMSFI